MTSTTGVPPNFAPSYGTCNTISDDCPVSETLYGSQFNLPGNVFFACVFGILCIAHIITGVHFRTWPFSIWVTTGLLLETLGYIARSVMHSNPWSLELLSLQLCTLLWGPTCIAAGISLMYKHIVLYAGPQHSTIIKPKWIPWIFVGTDVMSLIIQGIGGIIASVGTGGSDPSDQTLLNTGSDMVITGVAFQVANMVFCGGIALMYLWRFRTARKIQLQQQQPEKEMETKETRYQHDKTFNPDIHHQFKIFVWAMGIAFLAVLVRCIYRVPEMATGWANPIMRHEPTFLIFDGTMVCVAGILITCVHPGKFFPCIARQGRRPRREKCGEEVFAAPTAVSLSSSLSETTKEDGTREF